ncbi:MAG: protein kinase [Pirellulaceae bacterium]
MNSDIMQCDDRKLKLLLAANAHDVEHDPWIHHVEQCSQCQSRLRELVANDNDWQKAAAALASDEDDMPCFRGDHEVTSSWNEAMVKQLLNPPSHPEMLGRLGRYEMERMIGSGGMGIVFKAFDTELNRVVAIKLLAPYLAVRGSARQRFAREARAAAGVRDDHAVPIFNVESEHEPPFLVMQYVAGGSLQEKLEVRDQGGNELTVTEFDHILPGGAIETVIGETPEKVRGKPLRLIGLADTAAQSTPNVGETILNVTPGTKVRLQFQLSDFSDGTLSTGEATIEIADHERPSAPTPEAMDSPIPTPEAGVQEAIRQFLRLLQSENLDAALSMMQTKVASNRDLLREIREQVKPLRIEVPVILRRGDRGMAVINLIKP